MPYLTTAVGPKSHWTQEEDIILSRLVEQHGAANWSEIAKHLEGRSGKSCRLRWLNQVWMLSCVLFLAVARVHMASTAHVNIVI